MLITSEVKDGKLYLRPHGKIDTANAVEAENLINAAIAENPECTYLFDAEDLSYISSSGLRILLRLRKNEPDFEIINAGSEVYEILDMTGFTEMMTVSKAFKQMCVDGCTVIGKGAKGTVYRYDADTVVKVYNSPDSLPDIKRERELARKAFVLGIPTAISFDVVKVGDLYGSVFELLDAATYSEMIRDDREHMDRYVKDAADLLRQIHETPVKKTDMPPVMDLIERWISQVKDELGPEVTMKVRDMAESYPETLTMIHGDFHTNNIMFQNGEAILIDMDTLSYGNPIFELASTRVAYMGFQEYDPRMTEDFIGLPAEVCTELWFKFLGYYLQTEDQNVIMEKEKEIRFWSDLRVMRHFLRRGAKDTEKGLRIINICKERVLDMLA